MSYIDFFFLNFFYFILSAAVFLTTIRFGDKVFHFTEKHFNY